MKSNSMKKLAMSLAIAAVSMTVAAQGPNIYFGLGTGFHSNKMKYSDLNETRFPTNENLNSGVLSTPPNRWVSDTPGRYYDWCKSLVHG